MDRFGKVAIMGTNRCNDPPNPERRPMENRVLQVAITCIIVIVFWNLGDFILDEYVMRSGWNFDAGYNILLPIMVALGVEMFPKRRA